MIKIVFLITGFLSSISIYSISFNSIDGEQTNFSDYQGKKILIVNTATNSRYVAQYASLEQLYQLYKDSLVVIAFPSNSFGYEPQNNANIKSFVSSNYNIHFILGEKGNVTGSNQTAIYQWLTQQSRNGMLDDTVRGDFQKFLIDKDGMLIGVFAPVINPMDNSIRLAITGN